MKTFKYDTFISFLGKPLGKLSLKKIIRFWNVAEMVDPLPPPDFRDLIVISDFIIMATIAFPTVHIGSSPPTPCSTKFPNLTIFFNDGSP